MLLARLFGPIAITWFGSPAFKGRSIASAASPDLYPLHFSSLRLNTCTSVPNPSPTVPLAMSTETTKVRAKVAALNASLDKLETELAPLLDKPLAETLAGLEPIEKARLQTLLPYIIYDLSFSE